METKPIYRMVKSVNGRFAVKWDGKRDYNFMPKQINRDNKEAYNTKSGWGGGYQASIRVPSLKRSDKVWRNFYTLFPHIKGLKTYRGCKLKMLKN